MSRYLQERTRIATSGARAVAVFEVDGRRHLAIPQLALDVDGTAADMNGGDSTHADVLVLHADGGTYQLVQRLPAPGGEDAEFFRIGERAFLAVASLRTGAPDGTYDFARPQKIFEWRDGRFVPFQSIDGYAAKQWRFAEIDGRRFLALAQGVSLPGHEDASLPSRIYEWTGERFAPFQDVDSAWGYNWAHAEVAGGHFLAYADHVRPSVLLRWDGRGFVEHQQLVSERGRAFAHFTRDGEDYLAVAALGATSRVLRWDGRRFAAHQDLDGSAGREFAVLDLGEDLFVVRVNFIAGPRERPVPGLRSQVYRWRDGRLVVVEEFDTSGATDVTTWQEPDGDVAVVVSNSLTPQVRFRTDTIVYRFVR